MLVNANARIQPYCILNTNYENGRSIMVAGIVNVYLYVGMDGHVKFGRRTSIGTSDNLIPSATARGGAGQSY